MTVAIARAVMALASGCLGDDRREWALAMEAELDAAIDDGTPLTFAAGCLAGALRGMPARAEGRFILASHAVALGLIVPIGALLVSGTLPGFPFLFSGHAGMCGWLLGGDSHPALLNASNRGAIPALALMVLVLIAGHLLMPWFLLERDWGRVAMVARLNAAATATLFLFTGILFLDETYLLLPAIGLAIELLALSALFRWHGQLPRGAPTAFQTP